ncbi:hypothetical protein ACFVT6_35940 [Streptomyces sp. NPDC058049]|uniref:hypothetical protein n=1 Tax=Streptomyces sp. NPDC058049 TaxID=3346314 RepID=UPI0036E696DC
MRVSAYRKKTIGAALAAVLLVGGATACESGKKDDVGKAAVGGSAAPDRPVVGGATTEALAAAYKKTSAAKSAKFRMTMSMPASLGAGGTVEMTGVQGWDPQVMDVTMKGAPAPGSGTDSMRVVMSNNVMFMEVPKGSPMTGSMEGKRWMKLDLNAAAQAAGDAEALKKLSGMNGMDQNQDPAKQLALLLSSPNVKHLGAEKVEGADAEHYKGTLSFEEMLAADESAKVLSDAERTQLIEATKKAGIKGYDMDVWLNKDGYPVHMKVGIGTPQGALNMDASYSDYGSEATVRTPPENETFDLFAMFKELGERGAGA